MIMHLVVSSGGKTDTARQVMERWRQRAAGEQDEALLGLAEAEILESEGRPRDAARRLAEVDRGLLDETVAPLAALLEGRLEHFDGNRKKAEKLFDGVRSSATCARARIELEDFLSATAGADKAKKKPQ